MMIDLDVNGKSMPVYMAKPEGTGPWPGVCVLHDALGMSRDVRNQADWLAGAGYLVAVPDLFDGGSIIGCIRTVMRDFSRRQGPLFDKVEAARQWLMHHEHSTGRVGLIGFCFGGGFALLLTPSGGYSVASVNYGMLPKDLNEFLAQSCPIVASYGARDRTLKGAAVKLETALEAAGVDHDVKEYPAADHAFLNDHSGDKVPFLISVIMLAGLAGSYHAESAQDARARILSFFSKHLKEEWGSVSDDR